MEWLFVLAVGVAAGTLGGIVGFGSSVILVPVLAIAFGPKAAVPTMAVASLLGNLSRAAVWRREIDWRAASAYAAAGVPAAALGARTMLAMDPRAVEAALGAFLVAMVPARRLLRARHRRIGLGALALVGAAIGFLTGIVASTGPVNAPFFLAHGLVRGAYLSTEAVGSAAVFLAKAIVFERHGALPAAMLLRGVAVGSTLMAGSWIAKRIVERMAPGEFGRLMDAVVAIAGVVMIAQAVRAG